MKVGARCCITVKEIVLFCEVKVISNRPKKDGTVDRWNYWDLEYKIENPLPGHGSYGRWKQWADGGSITWLTDH